MISFKKIVIIACAIVLITDCMVAVKMYTLNNYFNFGFHYQQKYGIELIADKKENTFKVEVNNQDISDELQANHPVLAPHMISIISWCVIGLVFLGIAVKAVGIGIVITLVIAIILFGWKFYQKKSRNNI